MLLAKFKKVFMEAKDLTEVYNLFFDLLKQGNLFENSYTIPEPTKKEVLFEVMIAIQVILKEEAIPPLIFLELPGENFYYGKFSVNSKLPDRTFFYFSDINMGAVTYVKSQCDPAEMVRFSLAQITDPKDFSSLH